MKGINKKMDSNKQMADLLFKNITKTPDDYEQMYPKRNLEEAVYSYGANALLSKILHRLSISALKRKSLSYPVQILQRIYMLRQICSDLTIHRLLLKI